MDQRRYGSTCLLALRIGVPADACPLQKGPEAPPPALLHRCTARREKRIADTHNRQILPLTKDVSYIIISLGS